MNAWEILSFQKLPYWFLCQLCGSGAQREKVLSWPESNSQTIDLTCSSAFCSGLICRNEQVTIQPQEQVCCACCHTAVHLTTVIPLLQVLSPGLVQAGSWQAEDFRVSVDIIRSVSQTKSCRQMLLFTGEVLIMGLSLMLLTRAFCSSFMEFKYNTFNSS